MKVTFSTNHHTEQREISDKDIYDEIAKYASGLTAPDNLKVDTPYGSAAFQLIKKGGAFFVREEYNNISVTVSDVCKTVYLVCVNPTWNNYKFYKLEDAGNGQIRATYGRIGAASNEVFGERTHYYPKHMYWIKVREKLNKGYKDMTDIYINTETKCLEETKAETCPTSSKNTVSYQLYSMLKAYSKHVVKESCISTIITSKMVEKARSLLNELYQENTDVEAFNKLLIQLLAVAPRKVREVQSLLAITMADFRKIIDREENLLMAMEALAVPASQKEQTEEKDGFEALKIKVRMATDKQREEVLSQLDDQLKAKVRNVYRIIHPEHKKRFEQYLKDKDIKVVKQLWHGSKNENWCSIITNGLLLRPNAVITGKMFGNGIYFAPNSMKSWGYTSFHAAYWTKGNSDVAFMGLYDCAYGTPKNVTVSGSYTQDMLDASHCNCVHAHAGTHAGYRLYNDEIVFYHESAMLLSYIVEFNKEGTVKKAA